MFVCIFIFTHLHLQASIISNLKIVNPRLYSPRRRHNQLFLYGRQWRRKGSLSVTGLEPVVGRADGWLDNTRV